MFVSSGAEPGPVLRDSSRASARVLCLPLAGGRRRLAALRPAVRAQTHLRVRHCHLVEGRRREPARG